MLFIFKAHELEELIQHFSAQRDEAVELEDWRWVDEIDLKLQELYRLLDPTRED